MTGDSLAARLGLSPETAAHADAVADRLAVQITPETVQRVASLLSRSVPASAAA